MGKVVNKLNKWYKGYQRWYHMYDNHLIEKSVKYPTTGKPNPFLNRLDANKRIDNVR